MVVKIVRGVYGYRPNPEEARIIRKDSESPAFELKDEEAMRLIGLGVAKECNTVDTLELHNQNCAEKNPSTGLPKMSEDELKNLGFNDLRKLAKQYDLNSKGTKEELYYRLKDVFVNEENDTFDDETEDESDLDDNDMPPELDAQEPI